MYIVMKKRYNHMNITQNSPSNISSSKVLIVDPMLATGGSVAHTIKLLKTEELQTLVMLA